MAGIGEEKKEMAMVSGESKKVGEVVIVARSEEMVEGGGEKIILAKPPVEVLQESNRDHGVAAAAAAAVAAQKSSKRVLKVPPRSFFNVSGYSERYLSPTDSLVSPISKGLLGKNRKGLRMLMPPPVPPKALETTFHRLNSENHK